MAEKPREAAAEAAVIDVAPELARIRELVATHIGDKKRRAEYTRTADAIEVRAGDPRLYVAFIGEFSSGKSTFINAMLRRPLLKASRLPTTAAVTQIEAGPELSVTAVFRGTLPVPATEASFATLRDEMRRLGALPQDGASLVDLLHLLTSDPTVASHVARITVTVPSDRIYERLVILDTPGINAGAEQAARHAAATTTAMSESVDATVVLIPATEATSQTLIEFLSTFAKPFLSRTIFILTSADLVPEDERPAVSAFARRNLTEKAGIAEPLVLEAGAIAMLPETPGAPAGAERRLWQERFLETESIIRNRMIRQRTILISERLVRLLQELVARLDADLESKQGALRAEQTVLRQNSVAAIGKVMETVRREAANAVGQKRREIDSVLSSYRPYYANWAKEATGKLVATANGSVADFEQRVRPLIVSIVEHHGRSYADSVSGQWKELSRVASAQGRNLAAQFERNYSAFKSLDVKVKVPAISVGSFRLPSMQFEGAFRYLQTQSDKSAAGATFGAAVGLAAATIFGFGIPLLIAAAVASSAAGSGINSDSVEVQRATVRQQLDSEIDRYFHALLDYLRGVLHNAAGEAVKQIDGAAGRHIDEYGTAVAGLIRAHRDREQALTSAIAAIEIDHQDLMARNARLLRLQRRLARS